MTPWDKLEQRLSDVIDRQFAAQFLFKPMTVADVNLGSSPDPDRPEMLIFGIFDTRHKTDLVGMKAGSSNFAVVLDIRLDAIPGGDIRRGDLFMRETTGDIHKITDIKPDGQGRAKLSLTHLAQLADA